MTFIDEGFQIDPKTNQIIKIEHITTTNCQEIAYSTKPISKTLKLKLEENRKRTKEIYQKREQELDEIRKKEREELQAFQDEINQKWEILDEGNKLSYLNKADVILDKLDHIQRMFGNGIAEAQNTSLKEILGKHIFALEITGFDYMPPFRAIFKIN